MASTVLGKVCITNKGAWSGTATYAILDVVTANGSSYLAKTAVPAGTQVTNTTYWQLIAAKGDKGNTGEITGASATINDSFGTPSVTVTPGGTSTERTFAFSFANLKGNGIESIEKTGTSGAVDTYTITFSDGTTTTFDVTNGSVTSVDGKTGAVVLDDKANIDGYYVDLTAGSAEQLLSTVQIEDKVPYNFRTSGGSADIGNRLTDKIVGGTICWNQLVQNGNFDSSSGWSASGGSLSVEDNVATFTASEAGGRFGGSAYFTKSHKYIVSVQVKTTTETDKICIHIANSAFSGTYTVPSTGWQTLQRIYSFSGDTRSLNIGIKDYRESDWDAVQVRNFVIYDLTAMFGSTIADCIYSLGHTAGIAWFKSLFPKDYYAYNAGEMLSVNVSSHDTVGFNAYDNASGKAKLAGGMEYQITGAYTALAYSTGETITPDANGKFTPSENGELTVTGGNTTDTCVHLVWDGEKDGEFEEYIKHSYPLDSSLTLRGVPILDANNRLYYDGDIYESDGTVTRRYGIVDLGTLQWTYLDSGEGSPCFYNTRELPGAKGGLRRMICSKYPCIYDWRRNLYDKSVSSYNNTGSQKVTIRDTDYTTASAFKAAMSGVYLIYELATPTTEFAEPFTNPQIVDDFGTEEYVDYAYSQGTRDVAVPVGHDTLYMNNLRAKLEMSPDSPDGDGDYIVRQSGGENVYVPLTKELPAAPSEDGNYVLKVTVADGTPTYSWEVQA